MNSEATTVREAIALVLRACRAAMPFFLSIETWLMVAVAGATVGGFWLAFMGDLRSLLRTVTDIAGVRIVCAFIADAYQVLDMLTTQPDVTVRTRDYKIGCIGAGMIMAECHLAAYKEAGFSVAAIASRTPSRSRRSRARRRVANATTRSPSSRSR